MLMQSDIAITLRPRIPILPPLMKATHEPFFSIILATYNRAYCLENAVVSVIRQSFTSWELLIVDDGSMDHTPELLKNFASLDKRIRVFRQTNQGPARARNFAIQKARGIYLAFIDSDDAYTTDHLESRLEILARDPSIDFLYGGMKIEGDPRVPDRDDPSRLVNLEELGIPVTGTFIVRRDAARCIGGFPEVGYSEDGLFLELAKKSGLSTRSVQNQTYLYNRGSVDSICTQLMKRQAIQ